MIPPSSLATHAEAGLSVSKRPATRRAACRPRTFQPRNPQLEKRLKAVVLKGDETGYRHVSDEAYHAAPGETLKERLLNRVENHMIRRLLDASPDGYALVTDGRVCWANQGLERMTGASPATLCGQSWVALFSDRGFGLPGGQAVIECNLIRHGLESFPVSVDRVALDPATSDGDEVVEGFLVRDLRTLRTLEDEVLRSGRRLHATNRELASARERVQREGSERDELLTVLSHELRTPVTVITGYNRLLLAREIGDLNKKQRHFLRESQKSCQRLDNFLGNLIEAAGKGVAAGPMEVAEASIQEVFENVADMLGPLLEDRALQIETHCAPGLPRVRFDSQRVEQVLINLVNTASRFAPPDSSIVLEANTETREARLGLQVAVGDRGPGVPVEDRERIFEPYVQSEASRQGGGLGLGLAICRRIVEAHGGAIGLSDPSDVGTRVVFWLPAHAPAQPEERG